MSDKKMRVGACPTLQLALTNCALVCPKDFANSVNHVKVLTTKSGFVFTIKRSEEVPAGMIWLNEVQRKWTLLSPHQDVEVCPFVPDTEQPTPTTITLEVEFYNTKTTLVRYDREFLECEFLNQFRNRIISVGERLVFSLLGRKNLVFVVKSMENVGASGMSGGNDVEVHKIDVGICNLNAMIILDKVEEYCFDLKLGRKYTKKMAVHHHSIIPSSKANTTYHQYHHPSIIIRDFQCMGIGGVDDKFKTIFLRAFVSRLLPPDFWAKSGCKHVKGILLYGPTGTGKTLMAHQIGKLWNSRKPIVVNGLELLAKDVRDAEADILKLFTEAQEEEKLFGPKSGLHIIIIDNIDAICREKSSVAGTAGVQTSLVKRLSLIVDGFNQINNVLVIGTADRKDSVFKGLLRPGRMEVHVEFGLPNESGRAEILDIHTAKLWENDMLSSDVDILELAAMTKNFTGAELEDLVRSAQSMGHNRLIEASSENGVDPETRLENARISMTDFKGCVS